MMESLCLRASANMHQKAAFLTFCTLSLLKWQKKRKNVYFPLARPKS